MDPAPTSRMGRPTRLADLHGEPVPDGLTLPASYTRVLILFFSRRRRHTRSVSAFLLNRSSDLKVRCRLALLPFLISCLIWLDLVASLPLIKERILVIILLLHFLSLMLGSVLVLMLPLLVWLTPDLRIKKSLLKCNWT